MDVKRVKLRGAGVTPNKKIDLFGVAVDDISQKEAVKRILLLASDKNRGKYVVTVNTEFIMLARRNPEFSRILANSSLALADGWFVAKSKLIFGGKEQERITGVDLVKMVSVEAAKKAVTIGYIGGFGSVAEEVSRRQKEASPKLKVTIAEAGGPTIGSDLRLKEQLAKVGRVDVLFVAYGMGKQEFWIDRIKNKVDVGVFIGVGGAFDYLSGAKKRAPIFLQNLGLEWLWRLFMEPARIWRQRVLPVFFFLVVLKFCKENIFRKIF